MSKLIVNYKDVRGKIESALDMIADPVVSTLSPMGSNVMYQDSKGQLFMTNDGVTIARHIDSDDPVESAIIEVVKHSALKTNSEAGDGTTTSILLSRQLVRDGLKLLDEGVNPMEIKHHLTMFGEQLKERLEPIEVVSDNQLYDVANISANNDPVIAADVVDVVKTAGQDGMVFIEQGGEGSTELIKDTGFIVDSGMLSPEMSQDAGFRATYEDVPVLVTDKRIYYEQEAETILRVAKQAGHESIVVVARDFIGKSVNVFLANHTRGNINVLLIKDPMATEQDSSSLTDLATYLGGELITEKSGKLVNTLTADQFIMAQKVYSNPGRTVLISNDPENKEVVKRIESIRAEKEDSGHDESLEKRLAALTNGMVTVKVGGATPIEIQERIFRYEDAINATRAAMKDGILPGGGIALLKAYLEEDYPMELRPMFRRYCEASIRQIANNCGEYEGKIMDNINPMFNTGYNAKTGTFGDMIDAGVIDPYKVTQMAIDNSISIAIAILTSRWLVINNKEDKDE